MQQWITDTGLQVHTADVTLEDPILNICAVCGRGGGHTALVSPWKG